MLRLALLREACHNVTLERHHMSTPRADTRLLCLCHSKHLSRLWLPSFTAAQTMLFKIAIAENDLKSLEIGASFKQSAMQFIWNESIILPTTKTKQTRV